jgi:hypothetical protein
LPLTGQRWSQAHFFNFNGVTSDCNWSVGARQGGRINYLVDTDVFILWQHYNRAARKFFRRPPGLFYYAKQTRKELLHPFLSNRERKRLTRLLKRFRRVNPDEKIATAFSDLPARYPYLRDHRNCSAA